MGEIPQDSAWLEINDDEITAVSLMSQIEERVEKRRQEHGRVTHQFPTFGQVTAIPEPTAAQDAPALYQQLRLLNELDGPPGTAFLTSTPTTRLPIIGRLWLSIRRQAHNLVLFYVNRSNTYNNQTHIQFINTLNELARLTQHQQQEIRQLKSELAAFKKEKRPSIFIEDDS